VKQFKAIEANYFKAGGSVFAEVSISTVNKADSKPRKFVIGIDEKNSKLVAECFLKIAKSIEWLNNFDTGEKK